jgi:hypothetical protein
MVRQAEPVSKPLTRRDLAEFDEANAILDQMALLARMVAAIAPPGRYHGGGSWTAVSGQASAAERFRITSRPGVPIADLLRGRARQPGQQRGGAVLPGGAVGGGGQRPLCGLRRRSLRDLPLERGDLLA